MDAPERICVVNCGLPADQCACYRQFLEAAFQPTILATEHARIVAEKDARIAELEEALKWYGDETQYEYTYEQLPCECCTDIFKPIERDDGSIARAALKGDDNG